MLFDLRSVDPGVDLTADVCVVGGGPAGLAVADGLRGSGLDVLLLESGGPDLVDAPQHLGVGDVVGDDVYARLPLAATRRRQLGGTATAWDIRVGGSSHGVRLVPFTPAELEARRGWFGSGWPLTADELRPYYVRAQALFGASPDAFEVPELAHRAVGGTALATDVFRFAVGEDVAGPWRDRVVGDPDTRVAVHATALELVPDAGGTRVEHVSVADGGAVRHRVVARAVVLAAGGIENARLLLASAAGRGGLGNDRDLVGRTFMDHPLVRAGVLRATTAGRELLRAYRPTSVAGAPGMGRLRLGDDELRARQVPASAFVLLPRPRAYDPRLMSQLKAHAEARDVRALARAAARGRITPSAVTSAVRWRLGAWPQLSGGWPARVPRRWRSYEVLQRCEQIPVPGNRVVLSDRTDALGAPVADVQWRWTDDDRAGAVHAQDVLGAELERAGCGRLEPERTADGQPVLQGGTHHHMGTTRMGLDPGTAVVDRDGRLFGVANCFVAGSSLFPTSGAANPTLTIVALAVRLADRLRQGLGGTGR